MLIADITLTDVLWSMFVFFMFFIWIMILFQVFGDLFRDHEESGVSKVLWVIFIIVFPFLGVFVYLIVRGRGMAERSMKAQAEAQKQFDSYVQSVAGSGGGGGAADQIAKAKELLDSGAIDQAEFDRLKAKALG
ncbi:MAG: SHOCT domain-containing protein [Acidimicrobiales bacterium]